MVQEVSAEVYLQTTRLTVTHYLFIAAAVCLLILIICMCYKGCCKNHGKDDPDWDEEEDDSSRRIIVFPQRASSIPSMIPVHTTHNTGDYETLEEYGYPAGPGESPPGVPAYRSTSVQPSAPPFVPRPPSYEESVRPSTSGIQPTPTDNPPPYTPP